MKKEFFRPLENQGVLINNLDKNFQYIYTSGIINCLGFGIIGLDQTSNFAGFLIHINIKDGAKEALNEFILESINLFLEKPLPKVILSTT